MTLGVAQIRPLAQDGQWSDCRYIGFERYCDCGGCWAATVWDDRSVRSKLLRACVRADPMTAIAPQRDWIQQTAVGTANRWWHAVRLLHSHQPSRDAWTSSHVVVARDRRKPRRKTVVSSGSHCRCAVGDFSAYHLARMARVPKRVRSASSVSSSPRFSTSAMACSMFRTPLR